MSELHRILAEKYDPSTQLSMGQASVIGSVLRASGPSANMLVFGCGNDSMLWREINADGYTVFVENHLGWATEVREKNPSINIEITSYKDTKVSKSLPINVEKLRRIAMPEFLAAKPWDVILVDAPGGFSKNSPGRSLPIYWSSLVASKETHVFIDDYERPLERAYAEFFFATDERPWSTLVPRVFKVGKPSPGQLFWSIGVPDGTPG